MPSKDINIAVCLNRLRKELSDPKWNNWYYIESMEMYKDLQSYARELDELIDMLKGPYDERTRS